MGWGGRIRRIWLFQWRAPRKIEYTVIFVRHSPLHPLVSAQSFAFLRNSFSIARCKKTKKARVSLKNFHIKNVRGDRWNNKRISISYVFINMLQFHIIILENFPSSRSLNPRLKRFSRGLIWRLFIFKHFSSFSSDFFFIYVNFQVCIFPCIFHYLQS